MNNESVLSRINTRSFACVGRTLLHYSSSLMSRSRWTARVPSNLVYPPSAGSTTASSTAGTRSTTNRQSMCLRSAMCAGTSLSSREMCPKTEMRRAARISPNGVRPVYVPARRHYWRSQTSEFPVSDADISRGRPLTLLCLLLEESKFLLHISIRTKPEPHKPATSAWDIIKRLTLL